jgi:hypothetical protein
LERSSTDALTTFNTQRQELVSNPLLDPLLFLEITCDSSALYLLDGVGAARKSISLALEIPHSGTSNTQPHPFVSCSESRRTHDRAS